MHVCIKVKPCSAIYLLTYNHMVAFFCCVKYCSHCSNSACKRDAVLSVFNSRNTLLQSWSGWVTASGVLVFSIRLGDVLLSISWTQVDGHIDTTVNLFRLLSDMNGKSRKAFMSDGQVVFLFELLELDFGFLFGVKHFG